MPSFSEVFDVHNPTHIAAAASILLGENREMYQTIRRNEGKILPSGFWEQFGPETGGIVGLHAVLTRKLAEEYLFQNINRAADIEEESDGDDHDGLGLHSGDSNTEEDDTTAFFKL